MTDTLPPGRPDFEPPNPSWVWPGPAQAGVPPVRDAPQVAPPPGLPVAPGPVAPGATPAWHPGYAPPAAAVPPPPPFPTRAVPEPVILPPGPYKQPWPPPPPPSPQVREARGSFLFGMGISLVTLALAWWVTIGTGFEYQQVGLTTGALSVATAVLIVLGIVLVLIPRTMRTGAGVLVGFIVAMLVAGAVWLMFVLNAL